MDKCFLAVGTVFCIICSLVNPGIIQANDVAESKDHPLISRYSGSLILGYDVRDYDAFVLPIGKQGSDSKTEAAILSKKQTLEGKITRILYASPEGRSSLEVLRNYQQSLVKAGFETLFSCAQNQCGERLNAVLYPLDRRLKNSGQISEYALEFPKDQRYLAAKWSRPEGTVYVSIFVGVCGINNFKETFNHPITLLEIIETKAMETGLVTVNAETMKREIEKTGHVSIYGIYFDTDKVDIKPTSETALGEIRNLLRQNPQLKIYLVGHTDNVGNLNYNLDLSQRRSEAVVSALIKKYGTDPKQLMAKGVGPLAPVASNQTEEGCAKNRRVELVKQ